MIRIKRAYEPPSSDDGFRVLVDRLWPRGINKTKCKLDLWLKDIAPSDALRRSFAHDPGKWHDFETSYNRELDQKADLLAQLKRLEKEKKVVTLIFAARDEERNNAVALRRRLTDGRARRR